MFCTSQSLLLSLCPALLAQAVCFREPLSVVVSCSSRWGQASCLLLSGVSHIPTKIQMSQSYPHLKDTMLHPCHTVVPSYLHIPCLSVSTLASAGTLWWCKTFAVWLSMTLHKRFSFTLNSCLCSCTVRGVVFLLALQLPLLSEATVLVTGAVRSWISRNDWKMQDSIPVEKSTCYIPIRICDQILLSTHWKGGGFDDIRNVILELCAYTILAAYLTTQGLLMKSTASNGRMLRGEETWWKLM